jgi:hypothetical protein
MESQTQNHIFHYCLPDKSTIKTYQKKNIRVTAIQYITPIGLLIVGFDFGGVHIWRVDSMQLMYVNKKS